GCYTTSAIAPAQITTIAKPLSAPADLPGAVRLGPRTEVRARLQRGWVTTWYSAGDLAVGEDGLVTGRRYRLAWADRAILSGTDAAAAAVLAATAPPEATIAPTGGGHMLLVVSQRRFLLPWIAAYASAVGTRGAQAGMLSFHSAGGGDGGDDRAWWSAPVPAASFAGATPRRLAEIQIAEGVPWRNVTELELQNLSPIKTTAVIIGTPFA